MLLVSTTCDTLSRATRWFVLFAGLVGASVLISSCKTTTVDDAKNIATEFKGSQLILPPRGVQDVIDLIRSETPESQKKYALWRARAAQSPEAGLQGKALAKFYADRGEARDLLGQAKGAIADLKKSVEIGRNRQSGNRCK